MGKLLRNCSFWETKYSVLSMHFKHTRANKTGFFIFYAGLNLYMLVITQNNVSIQVSFKIRLILNGSRLLSKLDYEKIIFSSANRIGAGKGIVRLNRYP